MKKSWTELLVLAYRFKLNLLKVLFGPLLLYQGGQVRKQTAILSEPNIDSTGQTGSGPMLSLLLLGDSSAAGVGAESAQQSLLGQLIKHLSSHFTIRYQMLASTGKTTADTLADISQVSTSQFDVVITALGVNDVTSQVKIKRWKQQQQQLIDLISEKFEPQQVIMSGLPPVRDFPALPWPLNSYLGTYADMLDEALIGISQANQQVKFHSLRGYPEIAKAASDGFHPGPKVYELWAEYLVDMIDKP